MARHTVKLTAEVSERNLNGRQNKVIRIYADSTHVYTRTCVIGRRSGRIRSHKANFRAAKQNNIQLSSSFCEAIKSFANTFGKDGEYFKPYASRFEYIHFTSQSQTSTAEVVAQTAFAVWAIATILKS